MQADGEIHHDVIDHATRTTRRYGNHSAISSEAISVQGLCDGADLVGFENKPIDGFQVEGFLEELGFGLNSGASNTDFIDNAGGVDCSDHEVNIKILLNEIVTAGDMTGKQRNTLLSEMTEDVGNLVLGNNYKQTQALSLAERGARERQSEYKRLMAALETSGKLDRALEFLPTDEELNERATKGQGLTRPELSVLISYSKIELQEALIKSDLSDDDYLSREIETAFPPRLAQLPECPGHHCRLQLFHGSPILPSRQ